MIYKRYAPRFKSIHCVLATFRNHLLTILGDVTKFESDGFKENFDRVISIEMFEHMKNYELLLGKISGWIRPGGKLFVHIFTHKWKPYHFVDDWMARTFFTGEAITIIASFSQVDTIIPSRISMESMESHGV